MLPFKGLKWLIIDQLSKQFPLSVSDFQKKLTKENKLFFSNQALHKALNQLIKNGVITKTDHTYQLKTEYILSLDNFIQDIKKNYFLRPTQSYQVNPGSKKIFTPKSLAALDKLWNDILKEKLEQYPPKSEIFIQHFPHAWFNLVHMAEEIKIVNEIISRCQGFYTLVNGSTLLDQWIGKFYTGKKLFYKMKKKPSEKEQGHCLGIIGDYILEAYYPKNTVSQLEEIFNTSTNLQDLQVSNLISLTHSPVKLNLTLYNNSKKAALLRRKILKDFKE